MGEQIEKIAFLLAVSFILFTVPATVQATENADRYREQKTYWDRIYHDIEKSYGEGYQVPFGFIDQPPIASLTVWAPAVWHIAIFEDGLSGSEKEQYASLYENTQFPLYCGYIIFGHDKSFTFVKKTDLPIESVTKFMRYWEKSPPVKHFDYYIFRSFLFNTIALVKLFDDTYGMDFVPKFKHQYPYGQPPEGMDRKELLKLENDIRF